MGVNDAAEMLEVAKAECARLERELVALAARKHAAEREALVPVIRRTLHPNATHHWEMADSYAGRIADALLAPGGPLVDVREVQQAERRAFHTHHPASAGATCSDCGADAVRDARAQALEDAAEDTSNRYGDRDRLLARAAEIREAR